MNVIEKLDALSEIQAHKTLLDIEYDEQRKKILATVQAELDALDIEINPQRNQLSEQYGVLEMEIKADVLAGGSTVHGKYMMAVWSKPRITWDSKQLDGLMIAIPQLAQARREGEPSVSIRKV
jgi:hypothetical protein